MSSGVKTRAAPHGGIWVTRLSDDGRTVVGQPTMVAIDDPQWLDVPTRQALGFALRRLDAEPLADVPLEPSDRDRLVDRTPTARDLARRGAYGAADRGHRIGVEGELPALFELAGGGNDTMTGSGGRDTLKGGRGDDTLTGSQQNDHKCSPAARVDLLTRQMDDRSGAVEDAIRSGPAISEIAMHSSAQKPAQPNG